MTIRIIRVVLVALAVAALSPQKARAYCGGSDPLNFDYDPKFYSVPKEWTRSKYVVKARSVREIWLGEDGKEKPLKPPFQNGAPRPWGFDPYIGAYYDVVVLQAYKGIRQPACGSSARTLRRDSSWTSAANISCSWMTMISIRLSPRA